MDILVELNMPYCMEKPALASFAFSSMGNFQSSYAFQVEYHFSTLQNYKKQSEKCCCDKYSTQKMEIIELRIYIASYLFKKINRLSHI